MDLIGLILLVLVLCVVYWAIHRLAAAFGLANSVVAVLDVLDVLLVLIFVFYLLRAFGLVGQIG